MGSGVDRFALLQQLLCSKGKAAQKEIAACLERLRSDYHEDVLQELESRAG